MSAPRFIPIRRILHKTLQDCTLPGATTRQCDVGFDQSLIALDAATSEPATW